MSDDIKNLHVFGMVLERRAGALCLLVPLDSSGRITLFGGSGFEDDAQTMIGLLKKEIFDESGGTMELFVTPEDSGAKSTRHSKGWVPSRYASHGVPQTFYEERYKSSGSSRYGVVYLVPEDAWRRLDPPADPGEDAAPAILAVALSDIHARCLGGDPEAEPDMGEFERLVMEEQGASGEPRVRAWESKDDHNQRSERAYRAFVRYVVAHAVS